MSSSISLILTSEFDINLGPQIKQQYPVTTPLFKDQLPFLSEILIPDQLHNKSVDKEDFTLFPIYQDPATKQYKYSKTNELDEQLILFTVCNYKYDATINRNYAIKSLSIITKLPFFINLKPIMIMLLENYFQNENFDSIKKFFKEINKYPLLELCKLIKLTKLQRLCYLEYLKKNEWNNELNKFELVFGSAYQKLLPHYSQNKDNLEIMIPIELQKNISLKIPLRISIYSLLGSDLQFFGYNLDHDNVLKNFINSVNDLKISDNTVISNKVLFPLGLDTPMLMVIINAMLSGKKIIVISYTKPIMIITEFILAILILLQEKENSNQILRYNAFPYFDISKMDLLRGLKNYILGTTNPIFKEITDENGEKIWDLLIDLDANEAFVLQKEKTLVVSESPVTSTTNEKKHLSMLFGKGMKFPNFKKLNKRNSVNSTDSSSSIIIDEYFKDDYSLNENEDGTFKFDFEKTLLLYGLKDQQEHGEQQQNKIVENILNLNKLVNNKQDDILIYMFFIKEIDILGYDIIFKNFKLCYNLNKLINYRTFRYGTEFKGLTQRHDLQTALEIFEKSVIQLNNDELVIPYNFNIFQLGENDKEILEFHNNESIRMVEFIKLFNGLYNYEIDLSPEILERDLKYSVNVMFYINKLFDFFVNLKTIKLDNLQDFLIIFRSVLYQLGDLLQFFYYLNSITKKLKFGNEIQNLNFIQILIIMQKFIKTNDDCNLEINKILYKFKEHWFCSKLIDELVSDII